MGKSTISMAIFNSYVSHYQRVSIMTSPFEAIELVVRAELFRANWDRIFPTGTGG
jgi:hypothetical protein